MHHSRYFGEQIVYRDPAETKKFTEERIAVCIRCYDSSGNPLVHQLFT